MKTNFESGRLYFTSYWYEGELSHNIDSNRKSDQFQFQGLTFYFSLTYIASKQSLIYRVFLTDGVETASKFTARITVFSHASSELIHEVPVLSIEDLADMDSSQAYDKYWVVSYDEMRPFIQTRLRKCKSKVKVHVEVK